MGESVQAIVWHVSGLTIRSACCQNLTADRSKGDSLRTLVIVCLLCLGFMGCAGPKPVLYPNTHLKEVGEDAAQHDITECQQLAEEAGATPAEGKGEQVATSTVVGGGIGAASGAVGGAVVGAAGRGAGIGAAAGATAGLLRALLRRPPPSQAYINFVNRCLRERGYDPVGWQ